jgi:hypothetical protein
LGAAFSQPKKEHRVKREALESKLGVVKIAPLPLSAEGRRGGKGGAAKVFSARLTLFFGVSKFERGCVEEASNSPTQN